MGSSLVGFLKPLRTVLAGVSEILNKEQTMHEHSVLFWQILKYPEDFKTDEASVQKGFKIAVGVCESCRVPVLQYRESVWPEKYVHGAVQNRLLFAEAQRVAN